MHRRGVRIVVSGRRDRLSPKMRQRIDRRWPALRATRRLCGIYVSTTEGRPSWWTPSGVVADGIPAGDVDGRRLRHAFTLAPEPDLIIRAAGERLVSNFRLWQSAYSEMLVTETLWPDFGVDDLKAALADYASRVRKFGGRP
jgi:undecaprenyl diphosphate synthase